MISVLNLIWIVPVSMACGAAVLICVACVIVGKQAEEKWNAACSIKEKEYDH